MKISYMLWTEKLKLKKFKWLKMYWEDVKNMQEGKMRGKEEEGSSVNMKQKRW